ncbi:MULTISPECIES: CmpA/NrtA family ABC transporter substrate-binding protein [unclassified Rhizobium]|uniref:CmpA/NrtA family ABC transporter substrate-binding protein n=1 Tax=unclassified Rhizobium TaxID=2613769 RepID=UPI00160D7BDA|nr:MULTISPECIES: CmpA/NrtA family ABC transporter substrate-binding protein [unclassified Rhizobium]MBB3317024.1 NitT/TauT family transport system ATP-binding protein [Rhizobium sp. BK181]MBB3541130.1 NitT/TauT family transport system ATP-binding protein [Rhizobium sp. BK399]MCS3739855.1 NitT/TauT family transport system ATP-binding protein [Rhizobium sp. BK661]MCS4092195.1 NitT/TauT family transport system ATP-binding protein [Rhizobium sp. BK176]
MTSTHQITAGFLPLLDSALLVVAKEKGLAAEQDVALTLVRERSWATIRDRLAVSHFDVAHILAPMPIACNLGLTAPAPRMIVPMALGLGGNAVTVSAGLWSEMAECGASPDLDALSSGLALRRVIDNRKGERLRFGVVHPYSGHNYELRYWLAASGIDPEEDVEIGILPPPDMADAMTSGLIDGYCAGEPWNTLGVLHSGAHLATVKAGIWKSSPEKVLGVNSRWADGHPEALAALLRALYGASLWCADTGNREELANLLARPAYVDRPAESLLPALTGLLKIGGGETLSIRDFFVPNAKAATFPWKSHALWFYTQMVRWEHIRHTPEHQQIANDTYRPDIYRSALKALNIAMPAASSKVEGALQVETPVGSSGALTLGPDGFFDGGLFDPADVDSYIASQVRS